MKYVWACPRLPRKSVRGPLEKHTMSQRAEMKAKLPSDLTWSSVDLLLKVHTFLPTKPPLKMTVITKHCPLRRRASILFHHHLPHLIHQ
jgi:hypothetical protein